MRYKFVCADHQVTEIAEELVVAIVNYAPSLILKSDNTKTDNAPLFSSVMVLDQHLYFANQCQR